MVITIIILAYLLVNTWISLIIYYPETLFEVEDLIELFMRTILSPVGWYLVKWIYCKKKYKATPKQCEIMDLFGLL